MMAARSDGLNILIKSPVFRGLPKSALDALAQAVEQVDVPQGAVITREGDPGDGLYVIVSGKVKTFRGGEHEATIDLCILGPGEIFGEMSLLSGETRSNSAQALEPAHLMFLPKRDYECISMTCPELSRALIRHIRSRVLRDEERMSITADKAVRASLLSPFHILFLMGLSVALGLIFNSVNPNGIALFPRFPDETSIGTITPATAMESVNRGAAIIVDAMPASLYKHRHIKGATNIPFALFDIVYMMTLAEEDKDKKIIVYGGTISRPYHLELAGKLILRGHENVLLLEGGMAAWGKMGFPLEGERKQ
ncbi:MAG: cyclic nucleotide-binding domain-containing protein [Deltaproteobacteria bacterium]|nr:cyclic nucleotide-binding domain-containing protein [Deltaproteobacteria bacterium]